MIVMCEPDACFRAKNAKVGSRQKFSPVREDSANLQGLKSPAFVGCGQDEAVPYPSQSNFILWRNLAFRCRPPIW